MAGLPETSIEQEQAKNLVYIIYNGSFKGWNPELLAEKITGKVEAKFLLCSSCMGVLRDACLFEKDSKQELRCSVCIPSDENKQIAKLNRETVNERQVCCPLKYKGCDWTDELSELLLHLEVCGLFPVACPLGCREDRGEVRRVERREVVGHKTLCPMRTVKCDYCNRKIKCFQMNAHLELCDEFPISCPNKCGEVGLKRKDEPKHLRQACPLEATECPYSQYGCEVTDQRRNLDEHEKKYIHTHLKLVMTNTKLSMDNLQSKVVELEKENKVLRTLIPSGTLDWTINGIDDKIFLQEPTYSSPFYVGLYKIRGCIEWDSEDNFAGLFLTIMKGDWDDTLKWPFRYKTNMVLINQLDDKNNYEFNPEITEKHLKSFPECFEKPNLRNNDSFGWSEFIPLDDLLLEKYSKDDSITLSISLEQITLKIK